MDRGVWWAIVHGVTKESDTTEQVTGGKEKGSAGKNPPAMQETQETQARSLAQEDPWRRAWQPTPAFLPEECPWTEESGGLQSIGLRRVGHD